MEERPGKHAAEVRNLSGKVKHVSKGEPIKKEESRGPVRPAEPPGDAREQEVSLRLVPKRTCSLIKERLEVFCNAEVREEHPVLRRAARVRLKKRKQGGMSTWRKILTRGAQWQQH
jgi:hypothetical protein